MTCEHGNASVMSQSRNATTRGHTGIGTRAEAGTGGGCVLWDSELAAWHMWLYHLLTIHNVLNICGAVGVQFANNCMHQRTSVCGSPVVGTFAIDIAFSTSPRTIPCAKMRTFKDPIGHPGGRTRVVLAVPTIPITILRQNCSTSARSRRAERCAMASSGGKEEKYDCKVNIFQVETANKNLHGEAQDQ